MDGYDLIIAVNTNDLVKLKQLLSDGVAVDTPDEHGNTALWRAVYEYRGDSKFIEFLLEKGANPDHVNKAGKTPRELANLIDNTDVRSFFN